MHTAVPFAGKHGPRPDVSDQVSRIRCALADTFRRPCTVQQPSIFGVQIAKPGKPPPKAALPNKGSY